MVGSWATGNFNVISRTCDTSFAHGAVSEAIDCTNRFASH